VGGGFYNYCGDGVACPTVQSGRELPRSLLIKFARQGRSSVTAGKTDKNDSHATGRGCRNSLTFAVLMLLFRPAWADWVRA
jgi:hypothetical protein